MAIISHGCCWSYCVLGIVLFGSEQIFELTGTIAVDKLKTTLTGDPSKASVASGGSWRIWPFSSRRSSSKNGMQLVLSDARASEAENASESSVGMDGSNTVPKPKPEKMMKAMTPTSEQLASLNLKEGKNIVTFTFSTAMLGKQQVVPHLFLGIFFSS